MKAKIRKTGEIVDVIAHNQNSTIRSSKDYVSYIDAQGIEHDRESLNYYWDFEPIVTVIDEHWQDVRERAAIAAMQAMLSYGDGDSATEDVIAEAAVEYADALIEELKKK